MAKTKEQKKREVLERAKNKFSAIQKLELIDKKFGKGKGATKERAKLQKLIDNAPKLREDIEKSILDDSENGKKKFKVKKGEDPIKAKKKRRREIKEDLVSLLTDELKKKEK
jgi:hypothetical protein